MQKKHRFQQSIERLEDEKRKYRDYFWRSLEVSRLPRGLPLSPRSISLESRPPSPWPLRLEAGVSRWRRKERSFNLRHRVALLCPPPRVVSCSPEKIRHDGDHSETEISLFLALLHVKLHKLIMEVIQDPSYPRSWRDIYHITHLSL